MVENLHIRIAKLAFYAKESPIRTRDEVFNLHIRTDIEKVPMKLGSLMFKYIVTSFKWRPKGVSSFG